MEKDCFGGLEPAEKQLEAGGLTWNYLEWNPGGGKTILLAHGITSDARAWWRVGAELALDGARVIAVDMPGHGHTTPSQEGTGWRTTAFQLSAFAAALNLPAYRLCGHSWGGVVSLHVAADFGAGLERVALLDPALRLSQERAEPAGAEQDALVGQPKKTREEYHQYAIANMPAWSECDHYWKAGALLTYDPATVRDFFWHNSGQMAINLLGQVNLPLLLVISDEQVGGVMSLETQAEARAALIPELGKAVKLDGVGHNLTREDYDQTMRYLKPFLLAD